MTNAAFISCSGEDLEQAKVLENLLDHAGLPAWVYTKPLTGSQFPTEITEAITTSSCVIVLVSPSSASSAWVGRELHFAQENGIPIVPVLVTPTPTNSALHLRIAGMSRIDATKGFAGEAFDELCRAVKAHYRRLNPIVAVMNMKGGVGKTTLSANIFGGLFKWRHKNVLLVDLDPQYNLTQLLVHQRTHLALVEQDRSVISAFEPGRPLGRESPTRELTRISTFDGAPIDPTEIAHRLEFDPDSRARFDLILQVHASAKHETRGCVHGLLQALSRLGPQQVRSRCDRRQPCEFAPDAGCRKCRDSRSSACSPGQVFLAGSEGDATAHGRTLRPRRATRISRGYERRRAGLAH